MGLKNNIARMLNCRRDIDGDTKWIVANLVSGGTAGALSLCLLYSLEYGRNRLSLDKQSALKGIPRQYADVTDVFRKTLATDGISGLYRGFVFSCLSSVIHRACFFGGYDSLKIYFVPYQDKFLPSFCLGWMLAASAGIISHPFDTLRQRMFLYRLNTSHGNWHLIRDILHNEGYRMLFRGASSHLFTGVVGAGILAGFDYASASYVKLRLRI